jgi:hypothetical protein
VPTAGPRVAANPIPYWVVGSVVNKSREVFEQAFIDLSGIGFTAVKTDVPATAPAPGRTGR